MVTCMLFQLISLRYHTQYYIVSCPILSCHVRYFTGFRKITVHVLADGSSYHTMNSTDLFYRASA